jgi:hypothetical protein
MSGELPLCESAADLPRLDGRRVRLTGIYRPVATLQKMPRPGQPREENFLGEVVIELAGAEVVLDGLRPPTEIARFQGCRVTFEGRLALEPASDPETASQRPVPTLLDPSEPVRPMR